jgi:hypothetical protein
MLNLIKFKIPSIYFFFRGIKLCINSIGIWKKTSAQAEAKAKDKALDRKFSQMKVFCTFVFLTPETCLLVTGLRLLATG